MAVDGVADVLLLQFAREPRPGRVKTRMIPHLSPGQACDLHRELVLWTCVQLLGSGLGEVELCVEGDTGDPLFERCLALGAAAVSGQVGPDLGARMWHALSRGLASREKVILVGSDCPALSPGYLAAAVGALDTADIALGPALDGGYVLLGARRIEKGVFADVPWGSARVLAHTRRNLRAEGLDWRELPALPDVDRPADLPAWEALRDGGL